MFRSFRFETKLTNAAIFGRVRHFLYEYCDDYHGYTRDNGFVIQESKVKTFSWGRISNDFAPVAVARVITRDGKTFISVVIRMSLYEQICIDFIQVSFFLSIFFTPFESIPVFCLILLCMNLLFFRPAKRLKERIARLFADDCRGILY